MLGDRPLTDSTETTPEQNSRYAMRRGKEVIGMAVVARDTGQEISRVQEVIVHRVKKCVVCFLVRRASWFRKARVVPFARVLSVVGTSVTVPSLDAVVGPERVLDGVRLLGRHGLGGTPLISANGHEIGQICDFFFDGRTGEIEGFEVLTGYSVDAMSGPVFLPLDDDVLIGKDSVVVGEQAANRLMFEATEVGRFDPARCDTLFNRQSKDVTETLFEAIAKKTLDVWQKVCGQLRDQKQL